MRWPPNRGRSGLGGSFRPLARRRGGGGGVSLGGDRTWRKKIVAPGHVRAAFLGGASLLLLLLSRSQWSRGTSGLTASEERERVSRVTRILMDRVSSADEDGDFYASSSTPRDFLWAMLRGLEDEDRFRWAFFDSQGSGDSARPPPPSGPRGVGPRREAIRWLALEDGSGAADRAISASAASPSSVASFSSLSVPSALDSLAESKSTAAVTSAFVELMQRYAAAVLYFSTDGDKSWCRCSRSTTTAEARPRPKRTTPCESDEARFLSSSHVCAWHGLTCNGSGHSGGSAASSSHSSISPLKKEINSETNWVDLTNNGLSGTVPDEVFSLLSGNLQLLWLQENLNLTGTIPESIGKAGNLTSLSLYQTGLGGTIPEGMYTLTGMTSLRLYDSDFTGTISTNMGRLKNLEVRWG